MSSASAVAPAALGLARTPLDLQAVLDVLRDGHVREQRVLLEDGVDVAARAAGSAVTSTPPSRIDAGGRLLEAGDHPQHRGLARPRRAEDGEQLAVGDGQVGALDGDHLVGLGALRRTPCGRRSARSADRQRRHLN